MARLADDHKIENIHTAVRQGIIDIDEGFAALKAVREGDHESIKELYREREKRLNEIPLVTS